MLLILLDNFFPPLVFILQLPASLVSLKIETSEVWPCVTCAGGLRGGGGDESPLCGVSVSLLQKLCWQLHLISPPASSISPPSRSPSPAPASGQFEDFPALVPPSHNAAVGKVWSCRRPPRNGGLRGTGQCWGTQTSSPRRSSKRRARGVFQGGGSVSAPAGLSLHFNEPVIVAVCLQLISPRGISLERHGSVMLPCY